ncbi:hypothetical protein [Paenibacillus lemnae]|uniref:hypothetical protein n=1 Tax=Paenibacillus lemnae TaxID=1330551 RepID=UPI00146B60F2|nr:hypothetical protein [Paenibacillus lemnae]
MSKKKRIVCRHCAAPVSEYYSINYLGDYFCGDLCHETFHEANEEQFDHCDEDHPDHFDYSSIRREYMYWNDHWTELLQEITKNSNTYAQEANDFIQELDEIIEAYSDYILTEGEDGVFAYEIYQYTLKLGEIQRHIQDWTSASKS